MVRVRVISAACLLGLIAFPVWAGGLAFLVLVAAAGAIATWELNQLWRQGGNQPILPLSFAATLLLILQVQWPAILPPAALITGVILGSLAWALWHAGNNPATDWALSLASAFYLGWPLSHFVRLRNLEDGLLWLLVAALTIWAADIAAFFVGRAVGRHLWWPRHSPKKTWEGYLAGIVAGVLVASLMSVWLDSLNLLEGAILGLIVATIAPLGDLAESMIKRQAGAKDSSRLIPGHGGLLDRIDSLLFAIPLVYYWATLVAH